MTGPGSRGGDPAGSSMRSPRILRVRDVRRGFEADAGSVRAARRFTAETLVGWGIEDDFEWSALQVVSELATNAVIHARTPYTLRLLFGDDVLRVEVADASPRGPRQRHYGTGATTGRGLSVVAEAAQSWGVDARPAGKVVWAELVPPSADDEDGLLERFADSGAW